MEPLKTILSKDYSRKKKSEIVTLLTNLEQLLGPNRYAKVSGIDPSSELPTLNKPQILEVLSDFREAYEPAWERTANSAPTDVIKSVIGIAEADDNLFSAMNNTVSTADFAAELGSIDFEKLIGGPMNAAVTAQTNASLATVNFIKEVGFDRDEDGEVKGLKMANFSYKKMIPNPDYDEVDNPGAPESIEDTVDINVPFISILSIPSLRIETLDIDFNVKLNSTYSRDVSSSLGVDASVSGGWGPVKMKVSASYQRSASTGVKVEKEYSMGVKVKATNDEMPAGLEKVLGLLSE